MDLTFNEDLAIDYGINVSAFLQCIAFWTRTNAQNNHNIYEGSIWTYNTLNAFALQHKYFTVDQIRQIIKKCVKDQLLIVGNFNKKGYDRTKWYSLTDKALKYYPNILKEVNRSLMWWKSQMDVVEIPNACGENPTPIPVNLPTVSLTHLQSKDLRSTSVDHIVDKLKIEKSKDKNEELERSFDVFWDLYPKKTKKIRAKKEFLKFKDFNSTISKVIHNDIQWRLSSGSWNLDNKAFISDPDKYLRERRWEDERIVKAKVQTKIHHFDKPYKRAAEKSPYDSWPSVGIVR